MKQHTPISGTPWPRVRGGQSWFMALTEPPRPAPSHPASTGTPFGYPGCTCGRCAQGGAFQLCCRQFPTTASCPETRSLPPPSSPSRTAPIWLPCPVSLTLWEQLYESVRWGWLCWEVERRWGGAQQRALHRYKYESELKEGYQRSQAGAERGWAEELSWSQ